MSRGDSVAWPGSRCEACGRRLGMLELVPIASFLALRGRCRGCGAAIARMHLWVELAATAMPALLIGVVPGAPVEVVAAGSVLGWALLSLGWIDWICWRLPDAITLPLLLAGLAATWALQPDALTDHAIAALAAWAGLWMLRAGYARLRGREGLGLGDVKLLAAGGAWVGIEALPSVLLGAAVAGLALALARHGRRATGGTALPFGPPLCAAIWVTWVWGWTLPYGPPI